MSIDSFDPNAEVRDNVPFLLTEFRMTPGTPNEYAATYYFEVRDADGKTVAKRQGNLIPHLSVYLSAAEINGLKGIMDKLLAAAKAAV